MLFRFAYLHLTLAHPRSQGHALFYCKCVVNGVRYLSSNMNHYMLFRLAHLYLIFAHSRLQGHAHLDCEYVVNDDR